LIGRSPRPTSVLTVANTAIWLATSVARCRSRIRWIRGHSTVTALREAPMAWTIWPVDNHLPAFVLPAAPDLPVAR
jgi:hypothetical protein